MDLISTPNSGRTLLVIASDKVNMQIMTQLIARRDDINLMRAVNGVEGMNLADTSQPEAVVLDTALSAICVREVLKGLRGNPMTSAYSRHCRFVGCTFGTNSSGSASWFLSVPDQTLQIDRPPGGH